MSLQLQLISSGAIPLDSEQQLVFVLEVLRGLQKFVRAMKPTKEQEAALRQVHTWIPFVLTPFTALLQ